MPSCFFRLLFLGLLLSLSPVQAAEGNKPTEKVSFEVTLAPVEPPPVSADHLRELIEEAHEAFESEDEEAGYLRRWLDKFNYSQAVLRAYRWYLQKSGDIEVKDHAVNITLMLLTSHGLETTGGVSLVSHALAQDYHWTLKTLFTTIGVGITVPGLDPLCIALVAAYAKWPRQMSTALQVPRIVVLKSSSVLAQAMGIQAFSRWVFSRKDATEFLLEKLNSNKSGTFVWETRVEDYEFVLKNKGGEPAVRLQMERQKNNSLALTELELTSSLDRYSRKQLSRVMQPFGWNVREAVLEAFDCRLGEKWQKLESRPYVRKVTGDENSLKIKYEAPAIRRGHAVTVRPLEWFKQRCTAVLIALAGGGHD